MFLKPCPKCKTADATAHKLGVVGDEGEYGANVVCNNCGFAATTVLNPEDGEKLIKDAEKAWDTIAEGLIREQYSQMIQAAMQQGGLNPP